MFERLFRWLLIWRLWLFIPILLATTLISYRADFFYTSVLNEQPGVVDSLITAWANFDGVHYFNVSQRGYVDEARFLPLFPFVLALWILPLKLLAASLLPKIAAAGILSFLIFVLSILAVMRLLRLDYSSTESTQITTFLIAFPTAFFLVSVYSESLYLLLVSLSFYYARTNRWWYAVVFAAALSITRLSGVVMIGALGIEWLEQRGNNKVKIFSKDVLQLVSLLMSAIPILLYALYNKRVWGSFFYFISAHTELGNGRSVAAFITPAQTFIRYLRILVSLRPNVYEWYIALLELVLALGASACVYLLWRQKIRTSYLIFAVFSLILPMFSGTFTGLPRYILPIFPLFILVLKLPNQLQKFFIVALLVAQAVLLAAFSQGYFVA